MATETDDRGTWIENPIAWPDGARCAASFSFDVDIDSMLRLTYAERTPERLSTLSWLGYEEVAVPRLVRLYEELGVKQTFFFPGYCMDTYPAARRGGARGWPRGRPPRLPARGDERPGRRPGAGDPRARPRGGREADGLAAGGLARTALRDLRPLARVAAGPRLHLRRLADGRRPAVPAAHAERRPGRAAQRDRQRRLDPLRARPGLRVHDADPRAAGRRARCTARSSRPHIDTAVCGSRSGTPASRPGCPVSRCSSGCCATCRIGATSGSLP